MNLQDLRPLRETVLLVLLEGVLNLDCKLSYCKRTIGRYPQREGDKEFNAYDPYGASAIHSPRLKEAVTAAQDGHGEGSPSKSYPEGPSYWGTT